MSRSAVFPYRISSLLRGHLEAIFTSCPMQLGGWHRERMCLRKSTAFTKIVITKRSVRLWQGEHVIKNWRRDGGKHPPGVEHQIQWMTSTVW